MNLWAKTAAGRARTSALACVVLVCGLSTYNVESAPATRAAEQPDILFVLVDDLGLDFLPTIYNQECQDPVIALTPTLDTLASIGVIFDNFHTHPSCSPTRAALLTGLEPIKTGVGTIVRPKTDPAGLDLSTPLFFGELANLGYQIGAIGKWHVSTEAEFTPNFDQQVGADVVDLLPSNHDNRDYFNFDSFDGQQWVEHEDVYATEWITDRAIQELANLSSPKMLFVSYTAVHNPFHIPPPEVTYSDWSGVDPETDPRSAQKAMLESLDFFLGELFAATGPNTYIFLVSDNGSPSETADDCLTPKNQAKGTTYEGGIRVPAIVYAPDGAAFGVHTPELATITDIFPTLVELAGGDPHQPPPGFDYDFHSLAGVIRDPLNKKTTRSLMFTEAFAPNRLNSNPPSVLNQKAVLSSDGYKLLRNVITGAEELYDLHLGEDINLLDGLLMGSEQHETLEALRLELDIYSMLEELGKAPDPLRSGR